MLTPRKRLTKRELKEDKLVTFYYQAQAWFDENTRVVLIGAGAVIIILIAVFAISNFKQKAESKASVDLAIALRSFSSNQYEQAKPQLNSIVDSYGSTDSGKLARFYLASAMYKTGDYNGALEQYKKFAAGFKGDDYIKSTAMAGVAACQEQLEQYESAAEQYLKTAKEFSKIFAAPEYLFKAARCYQLAGNNEKASDLYAKIVQDYPDSEVKNDALLMKSVM